MGSSSNTKPSRRRTTPTSRNTQTATFDRYDAINTRVAQENAAKSQELQQANIQARRLALRRAPLPSRAMLPALPW
jgi:hypothetical protein